MIDKILQEAGFIKGETYKKSVFKYTPETTHAVYLEQKEPRGSDLKVLCYDVHIDIELYSPTVPDEDAENRIITALENHYGELTNGFQVDERIWIDDIQEYQTVFRFDYTKK